MTGKGCYRGEEPVMRLKDKVTIVTGAAMDRSIHKRP